MNGMASPGPGQSIHLQLQVSMGKFELQESLQLYW
jgi:hypothetical protein